MSGPDSDDDVRGTIVRRRPASLLYVLSSIGLLVGVLRQSVADQTFGLDFGVFYAGGSLIRTRGYDAAYNTTQFANEFTSAYFPSLADENSVAHFISTPPFGWFSQALTWLPFHTSMGLWLAVGVALLFVSVRLLGLPSWAAIGLLISPAMAFNLTLAQTGPFVLLLFVLIHRACVSGDVARAGLLAGLCILKPTLALGYGLLWLVQWRRFRAAIASALAVGAVLSVPTLLGGLSPWRGFLRAMTERTESEGSWPQQSPSIPEFLKLLAPQSSTAVTIGFWAAGLLGALCLVIAAHRRFGDQPDVMSAAAIVATVVGSPHLLTYDTFILVIPLAVAYRRGLLTGDRAGVIAAIISLSLAFGRAIYFAQYDVLGRGLSPELPALLFSCWLLVRWDAQAEPSTAESAAVLADA